MEERFVKELIQSKAELVFSTTEGDVIGKIARNNKFYYVVQKKNLMLEQIDKYLIEYRYLTEDARFVLEDLTIDSDVDDLELPPLRECKGRYRIDWRELKDCARLRIPMRMTFRSGDTFCGPIKWFGRYEICLELGRRPEIVGYMHALYDLQPLKEVPDIKHVYEVEIGQVEVVHARHLTSTFRNNAYDSFIREVRKTGSLGVPLVLRRTEDETRFELVDGLRRLTVAQRLGMSTVPAYILD